MNYVLNTEALSFSGSAVPLQNRIENDIQLMTFPIYISSVLSLKKQIVFCVRWCLVCVGGVVCMLLLVDQKNNFSCRFKLELITSYNI